MSDETPETTPETITDELGTEDFDTFWTAQESSGARKRRTTTIMGTRVTLPASLPLRFELEAQRLARSKRDQDVRKLVAILFGDDAMAAWTDKGMDLEQLMVLLAWAPQVIELGDDAPTLAEVAGQVREQIAKDAERRAGKGERPGEA